jgi:hypothetical protein
VYEDDLQWDWTCGTGNNVRWYRASVAQLVDAWTIYADWLARWYQSVPEPITKVHGSGAQMYAQMEPGYGCWVFAETNTEWTAVMIGGNGPTWVFSDLVPCVVAAIESGHSADAQVSRLFRVTGQPTRYTTIHGDLGRPDRIVSCEKTGPRWDFHVAGDPFEFEETDRYLLRDRGKRLTTDMLQRYADAVGIPLGEDEVLTGNGVYVRAVPYYHENMLDLKAAQLELVQMCQSRQLASD